MTTNTKNSFTRFAAAAKDCFYVNSFRADLVQCDRALKMDGEMHVEAECWMNILDALDDNDIKMYVDNEYRPGLLNPFQKQVNNSRLKSWACVSKKSHQK